MKSLLSELSAQARGVNAQKRNDCRKLPALSFGTGRNQKFATKGDERYIETRHRFPLHERKIPDQALPRSDCPYSTRFPSIRSLYEKALSACRGTGYLMQETEDVLSVPLYVPFQCVRNFLREVLL